jgi:hypothetical protein
LISQINYSFIASRLVLDTFDRTLVHSEAVLDLLKVLMRKILRCTAICYLAERACTKTGALSHKSAGSPSLSLLQASSSLFGVSHLVEQEQQYSSRHITATATTSTTTTTTTTNTTNFITNFTYFYDYYYYYYFFLLLLLLLLLLFYYYYYDYF